MFNVAAQLRQNYLADPERIAMRLLFSRQPDLALDWRCFMQGALGYAGALRTAGIQPGEVVILILQHGEALADAFFGAMLYGAVPSIMPFLTEKLSPEQYRQSLAALFQVTAPAAVITYPEFEPEVQQAMLQGPQPSPVRSVLLCTEIYPLEDVDFSGLAGLERSPQEIVLLQHSSGSTGLQKGVALSAQSIFNQLESYAEALRLVDSDVVVSWLPLYHDMGLIAGFIMPVLRHIPLVLMSPFDWIRAPYRMFQAVSQYQGSLSWLPNFAYNFCALKVQDRDLLGVNLASWRAVINCSEPMSWKSHQMFLERFSSYGLRTEALATCYAMAENVFAVSQGGLDGPVTLDRIDSQAYFQERLARPLQPGGEEMLVLSAGRPISNTRVRILGDADECSQRCDLPERAIGEIAISSDCMLTGYYHRQDATEQAFYEGWFLTGDLGYLADGEVYVAGRKKDLIIVGGKNIYPQDLETLANDVPGVYPGRTAAFGVFNEQVGTEDVVLLAEVDEAAAGIHPDMSPNERQTALDTVANEIRRTITRRSDVALRFVRMVEHGWLLKTSSGKIARSANREKYLKTT